MKRVLLVMSLVLPLGCAMPQTIETPVPTPTIEIVAQQAIWGEVPKQCT